MESKSTDEKKNTILVDQVVNGVDNVRVKLNSLPAPEQISIAQRLYALCQQCSTCAKQIT